VESIRPVLDALYTASRRDRKSLWSFSTNNLFLTALLLGVAGLFFVVVMLLVLLFPLTSDPLQKIPEERLQLWPLAKSERLALHWLSPWMNPVTWILAAIGLWAAVHRRVLLGGAVLLIPALGVILSWVPMGTGRSFRHVVPPFPGILGHLIRKDVREILSTLDFWAALALSGSCMFYRIFVHELPSDALMVFSILVVLALSSWSQSCFGLDGPEGLVRYRLLPVRGWQILAAKAAAFLLVVTLLALPLSLPTAWAAAFVALAVGNGASMRLSPQKRWRFSSGSGAWDSVVQIVGLVAAGAAAFRVSTLVLVPCVLLFATSSYWFGRRLFD
jgi:hypothetical protein